MKRIGIELCCRHCVSRFCVCRHCFRGHLYCSAECRLKKQKEQQIEAARKYAKTDKGRKSQKSRQERYRKKHSKDEKIETHDTSVQRRDLVTIATIKDRGCIICRSLIEQVVGGLNEYLRITRRQWRFTQIQEH